MEKQTVLARDIIFGLTYLTEKQRQVALKSKTDDIVVVALVDDPNHLSAAPKGAIVQCPPDYAFYLETTMPGRQSPVAEQVAAPKGKAPAKRKHAVIKVPRHTLGGEIEKAVRELKTKLEGGQIGILKLYSLSEGFSGKDLKAALYSPQVVEQEIHEKVKTATGGFLEISYYGLYSKAVAKVLRGE